MSSNFRKSQEYRDYSNRQARRSIQREKLEVQKQNYSDKQFKKRIRNDSFRNVGIVFRIIGLIFLIMIAIAVFWKLRGSNNILITENFLEWLSNLNRLDINLNVENFSIRGDWGVFNGLRNFLNIFTSIFGVIIWLFSNLLQLVLYVVDFIRFIFV